MTKRVFDLIFTAVSAILLTALSEYGFLERSMAFSFIPILIAYYLGKYSQIKFKK